jgi:hypothetical protein
MNTNKHDFKKSKHPLCPPGYILRDAYKTKTGKVVPDRCIKSTSGSNVKIEKKMMKYEKKLHKKLDEVNKKIMKEYCTGEKGCPLDHKCPAGKILREPYERKSYRKKDGTLVKGSVVLPSCITNRGAPGKGQKKIFIDPKDHLLSDFGYNNVKSLTKAQRREKLVNAIETLKKKGKTQTVAFNQIIHRLIGRANLQKKTNPDVYKIFKEDQEYISKMYKDVKGNNKQNKKKISEHITDMKNRLKKLKKNKDMKPHVKNIQEKIVIFKENISNSNKAQIKNDLSKLKNHIKKLEKAQKGGDLKQLLKKGVNAVKSIGKKTVGVVKKVSKKTIGTVKTVGKKTSNVVKSSYDKLKMKNRKVKKAKNVKKVKVISLTDIKMKLKKLQKSKNMKVKKDARKLYNKLKLVDKSKMSKERLAKFAKRVKRLEKMNV